MRLVHYRYKPEFAATAGIEATAPETGRDRPARTGAGVQDPATSVPSHPAHCPSPLETPLPGTPPPDSLEFLPRESFPLETRPSALGKSGPPRPPPPGAGWLPTLTPEVSES